MEEGTVDKWHKKEGEFVKAGELLLEIATDKATVEHTALDEGWLRKILVREGDTASVNQAIAIFSENQDEPIEEFEAPPAEKAAEEKKEKAPAREPTKEGAPQEAAPQGLQTPGFTPEAPLEAYDASHTAEKIIASPLAKRLAEEKGLDLSTVKGSGPGGRITSKDLALAQPNTFLSFERRQQGKTVPGSFEEAPLSPMRKAIAKRLQQSKTFIPHFYVKQTIDASPLFLLREQLKNLDLKVTFNDMVIRGAALALKRHPEMNAGYNSADQTLIHFKTVDVSVAVTVEGGLITPIIRLADSKTLGQISVEAKALAQKAKQGKLAEKEYKGGSFCVSNLGMFKITEFAAIINPPQAAILAVGGIEEAPVVKQGHIAVGKTMNLVLSADHRVIDGALAAQFMKTLQHFLENPAALLLFNK